MISLVNVAFYLQKRLYGGAVSPAPEMLPGSKRAHIAGETGASSVERQHQTLFMPESGEIEPPHGAG